MARVLIAGCGYVGTAVARLFLARRFAVQAWTRSGLLPEQVDGVIGRAVNLADPKEVDGATEEFDIVIQAASTRGGDVDDYRRLYLQGAQNLLRKFPSSRLLFVSSTSVYAQTSGEWVDEKSPAEPAHERGKILRAAEDIVLGAGGCVARFAGIYGPGRSVLLRRVLANEAVKDPWPDRYVNQIHRDDAAAALVTLAENGKVRQGVWNVADNEPRLLSESYRWLAAQLKRELGENDVPSSSRKRGASNKRVRNDKLRALGWTPAFPSYKEGAEHSLLPSV